VMRGVAVSIPFIAGQWSLRAGPGLPPSSLVRCFNPLHCGAVVASWGELRRAAEGRRCFNPLHCGAVVASDRPRHRGRSRRRVSIPFIAGQWSLREIEARREAEARVSIPFIAGQWSLLVEKDPALQGVRLFQSPSLRGSGRFPGLRGQDQDQDQEFQSPSLRGSGRFPIRIGRGRPRPRPFQSPSLRGSGRFRVSEGHPYAYDLIVSIPFIAGQWSLPGAAGG